MSIHVGNPSKFNSVKDAVREIPPSELNRPTISTVPMLSLMIHAEETFNGIVKKLGMDSYEQLILEYTAGPFDGKGQASHTDVMLLNAEQSLAIEAKWTEGMYPKVSKWKNSGKDPKNREAVLRGWYSKLIDDPDSMLDQKYDQLIYQMIHRAASAASAAKNPNMAYFLFRLGDESEGAKPQKMIDKLTNLWTALREPFPFHVVEIPMKESVGYRKIKDLPKRKDSTAEKVSEVLQGNEAIFDFLEPKLTTIGSEP
ncbi:MAG: hypothetical protein H6822_25810 [Planctomycetaceae bacterium]|nr:hypothetical protein [Planctomycetaceae bacterium]